MTSRPSCSTKTWIALTRLATPNSPKWQSMPGESSKPPRNYLTTSAHFNYATRFPESKTISKFTTTRRVSTFSELCNIFLRAKALELSAASHDSLTSKVKTLTRTIVDNTLLADIQYSDILRYRQKLLTGDVINHLSPWFNKKGRAASR